MRIPKRGPTAEQIDLLLEVADFRERVLTLALYGTGLRIAELLGDREKGTPPVCVEDVGSEPLDLINAAREKEWR